MKRNVHEHCGVRSYNGTSLVNGNRGVGCRLTARYSGTFVDQHGQRDTIGLCEQHATDAFMPHEAGVPIAGQPVVLESMHSLEREVYERNQARSAFAELVNS